MSQEMDEKQLEVMIASENSPVGIDAKKTHVMILMKLSAIERRLDALEQHAAAGNRLSEQARATAGMAGDAFDEHVERLRRRGVDVDQRLHAAVDFLERMSDERVLESMGRIVQRIEAIEQATAHLDTIPSLTAMAVDAFDEEIERLRSEGVDIDLVLRNTLRAVLYLGQRLDVREIEALGQLLRSDVLHPEAVAVIERAARALVEAGRAHPRPAGPLRLLRRLTSDDAKRASAFLVEFARRFGALEDQQRVPDQAPDRKERNPS